MSHRLTLSPLVTPNLTGTRLKAPALRRHCRMPAKLPASSFAEAAGRSAVDGWPAAPRRARTAYLPPPAPADWLTSPNHVTLRRRARRQSQVGRRRAAAAPAGGAGQRGRAGGPVSP